MGLTRAWWRTPVFPILGKCRKQEGREFKASVVYMGPCLKKSNDSLTSLGAVVIAEVQLGLRTSLGSGPKFTAQLSLSSPVCCTTKADGCSQISLLRLSGFW